MAYITGQTTQGCCLAARYLGNGVYECKPDVGELHRTHKIYNDYHMWYAKITGKTGENVTIHLKWPEFNPDEVSEEYKNWASYSVNWPSFFGAVKDVLYYSTDRITWTPIDGAYNDGNTVVFSLDLPSDKCYVCATLHYTVKQFELLKQTAESSDFMKIINLGKGWNGDNLLTFVATDFSVSSKDKKTVYIQGMQHCQEHAAGLLCHNMLMYLASESNEVKEILKKFIFRITPVVDITGWRLGAEAHPLRAASMEFNYNRDWDKFEIPEVKLISDYLEKVKADGESFVFLADIHGGTGDENDYSSGASISFGGISDERTAHQKSFVDLVRKNCDYLNPEEKHYNIGTGVASMFRRYADVNLGPSYTFEVSMSKMWDRASGRRFPNKPQAFERLGKQLTNVIALSEE